jgi:hypothetical protein
MWGLMTALRRKLGLIRTSGTVEVFPSDSVGADSFTIGGPSFLWTEEGIDGPLWPTMGNPSWEVAEDASPMEVWHYSI